MKKCKHIIFGIVAAISLIVMVIAYIIFSPIGVAAKGFVTYTVM